MVSGQSAQRNYFSDRRPKSKHIHKSPPHSLIFFFFSSAFFGLSPVQGLPRPFTRLHPTLSAASSCLTSTDFTSSVTLSIHKSALCSSSGPPTLTFSWKCGHEKKERLSSYSHCDIQTKFLIKMLTYWHRDINNYTQKKKKKIELKISHFM